MRSVLAMLLVLCPMTGLARMSNALAATASLACPCGCITTCNCCCRNSGKSQPALPSEPEHAPTDRCYCQAGPLTAPLPPTKLVLRAAAVGPLAPSISFEKSPSPAPSKISTRCLGWDHGPPAETSLVGITILVI